MSDSSLSVIWCKPSEFREHLASRNGVTGDVDGTTITSKDSLLTTIATALDFPHYFSPNWDSFEECLAQPDDLQDGDELTLGIRDASSIFALDEAKMLFSILKTVADEWNESKEGWRLNVVLEGKMNQKAASVLEKAGVVVT